MLFHIDKLLSSIFSVINSINLFLTGLLKCKFRIKIKIVQNKHLKRAKIHTLLFYLIYFYFLLSTSMYSFLSLRDRYAGLIIFLSAICSSLWACQPTVLAMAKIGRKSSLGIFSIS